MRSKDAEKEMIMIEQEGERNGVGGGEIGGKIGEEDEIPEHRGRGIYRGGRRGG